MRDLPIVSKSSSFSLGIPWVSVCAGRGLKKGSLAVGANVAYISISGVNFSMN